MFRYFLEVRRYLWWYYITTEALPIMSLRLVVPVTEVAVTRSRRLLRRGKPGSNVLVYLVREVVTWSDHYWHVCQHVQRQRQLSARVLNSHTQAFVRLQLVNEKIFFYFSSYELNLLLKRNFPTLVLLTRFTWHCKLYTEHLWLLLWWELRLGLRDNTCSLYQCFWKKPLPPHSFHHHYKPGK